MTFSDTATLLVIDVQEGFDDPRMGERNNPDFETNLQRLLRAWRESRRPIIFVRHDSTSAHSLFHPANPANRLKDELAIGRDDEVLSKQVNSAFIGTNLEARLREPDSTVLVVVGLTTDHCVSTTVRMAGNLGFETYLVADATATFGKTGFDGRMWSAEDLHNAALVELHEEFCTVINTAAVVDQM